MKRIVLFCLCIQLLACTRNSIENNTWSEYLGDAARSHYTTLDQIKPENLDRLEVAWTYNAPDTGQMQMNPIIANGMVYGVTAALKVFALDAATGEEKWISSEYGQARHGISRGVSYWEDGDDMRILFTVGKHLLALDAMTGKLIESFGVNGKVDLHEGLPDIAKDKSIISSTPGTVHDDLIIMPVRLSESEDAAPGDIRAFNVRNGSLAWTFHVIPYPGEEGYNSWRQKEAYKNTSGISAGNNWAGMAIDNETGIVYVPTGSFAPDFYGGHRKGNNLFSNCLLALDADEGSLIWYQQLVHHDIWDRDLPAPPNLLTVKQKGKTIDAVAQITKQGYVYLFNRKTGEPLFEIEEIPVPASDLSEEEAWPTQPIPVLPEPFARRSDQLTESDISPYAPNKDQLFKEFQRVKKAFYSPPDTVPTLLLPGYDGGAEWGGAGVDLENGVIYINSNEMAWMLSVEKSKPSEQTNMGMGELLYLENCAVCHLKDFSGNVDSGYPSLIDVRSRMSRAEILNIINNGKGMMTGYSHIEASTKEAVIDYIFGKDQNRKVISELDKDYNIPYRHTGFKKFLDVNGLPAISPPWGTLNAIDLNSGEYLWKIPFGEIDSLLDLGHPVTGTESYGGPIITKNGLLIIAATKDEKLRIYDKRTGKLLWKDRLPASSFATPSTYETAGKQFIVLACGGEKLGRPAGNKILAYALNSK